MEELIRQAFLHVEGLGPHVQEGHYDLIGPKGEMILPSVWGTTIEPDWTITMQMWPMPEPPKHGLGQGFRENPGRPHTRHVQHWNKGGPVPGPPLPQMRERLGTSPPSGSGPGGPPVIVNLTRGPPGSRHSKSKVRGWMKKANKLFSIKDKDGKLNLSILLPPCLRSLIKCESRAQ
jgi:hypothetical protein